MFCCWVFVCCYVSTSFVVGPCFSGACWALFLLFWLSTMFLVYAFSLVWCFRWCFWVVFFLGGGLTWFSDEFYWFSSFCYFSGGFRNMLSAHRHHLRAFFLRDLVPIVVIGSVCSPSIADRSLAQTAPVAQHKDPIQRVGGFSNLLR